MKTAEVSTSGGSAAGEGGAGAAGGGERAVCRVTVMANRPFRTGVSGSVDGAEGKGRGGTVTPGTTCQAARQDPKVHSNAALRK